MSPPWLRSRSAGIVVLALVLVSSLFLRLSALDGYATIDEPRWQERSVAFAQALKDDQPAATYQSEHPGVVVMWIGVAAEGIVQWVDAAAPTRLLGWDLPWRLLHPLTPGIPALTLWARRLSALLTWLCTVALVALVAHFWGRRLALLSAALLALDPFYLALSRVHHLDALLTAFSALSIIALLGALGEHLRLRWIIVSGVMAGLAIATKLPGLVLPPWFALVLAVWWLRGKPGARAHRLAQAGLALFLGLSVTLLTISAIWPALRVAPWSTLQQVYAGFMRQAWNPHENLNYFMGHIVQDPGPWFYPVALLWRSSPLVLLGFVGLAVGWRHVRRRPIWLALVFFVLVYGLSLMAGAKKFDRYLLPAFPPLVILAAVGLQAVAQMLAAHSRPALQRAAPIMAGALFLGQMALVIPCYPEYLAYYNPLLGGGPAASQVLLYGWGEGLGEAARQLNAVAGAEKLQVASHSPNEFAPFFVGRTTLLGSAPAAEPDYFVLYAGQVQRGFVPAVLERYYQRETPAFTITLNGLEYAWVYRNAYQRDEITQVLDYVHDHAQVPEDVVIVNADAAVCHSYDGPLALSVLAGPPRDDWVATALQRVVKNHRRIWVLDLPELYEDQQAVIYEQLGRQGRIVDRTEVGSVRATCYYLADNPRFVRALPGVRREYLLGEHIVLRGYDLSLQQAEPGGYVALRLYWEASQAVPADYKVFTHLIGPQGQMISQVDAVPQGYGRPTTDWQPGETIIDEYRLSIPSDAPLGTYELQVGMYDLKTMQRLPLLDNAGQRQTDDEMLINMLPVD